MGKNALILLLVGLLLAALELYAYELAPFYSNNGGGSTMRKHEIDIGVVLDMGSWVGKNIRSCITMAISDFYAVNDCYKTRLVLHTRDSRGDPRRAAASALDLLENVKVQAMLGPETAGETKSLVAFCDKAKVPMLSFSSILSLSPAKYPLLLQMSQDETFQLEGILSILSWFKWRTVTVIYEDTDDTGKDFIPFLVGSLQERIIRVTYKMAFSPSSTDDQILKELHKLEIVQHAIFIVHMSPSLSSRLFLAAKRLGMVNQGYAWIVTGKTMNHLQSMNWEVLDAMQGVVGLKAYIPSSRKLRDFRLRWKKEFYSKNPSVKSRGIDVRSIWAYDTIWALAESFEILGNEYMNKTETMSLPKARKILEVIAKMRFRGLSGEFKILDGKLHSEVFAIVNVIGKSARRVGFWTEKDGIVKGLSGSSAKRAGFDAAIIWPPLTTIPSRGRILLKSSKKLRIAVPAKGEGFEELVSIRHNNQANEISITGFCVEVFEAAIDSIDYQVSFEFIPLYSYQGSYNDLVYDVYLQKFDGIVGDLTITRNRSLYVDFTVPFTDLGIGTVAKRENNDIWLFLKPLRLDLWLTSAAFFVLTGFVVWVIEHSSNQEFQGSVAYQIGTILWFGFSTLFYAHRERLTSNLSRFIVIVWLFAVLILISSYTATLSSMLTLRKFHLASGGEYIGLQFNAIVAGPPATNLNFKDNRFRSFHSVEEFADALSRGSNKGGVGAIVDEIPYLKIFLAKYGADYAMVASESSTNGFGFAFQKGYAPLVSDLSLAIMRMREEGKLATMEKKWFKSTQSWPIPEDAAATPYILDLTSFSGLFLFTFLSCVLVLLLHLFPILRQYLEHVKNVIMVVGGWKKYLVQRLYR